jgi:hypothetical protein
MPWFLRRKFNVLVRYNTAFGEKRRRNVEGFPVFRQTLQFPSSELISMVGGGNRSPYTHLADIYNPITLGGGAGSHLSG